jgi:hypothetical protein
MVGDKAVVAQGSKKLHQSYIYAQKDEVASISSLLLLCLSIVTFISLNQVLLHSH